MPIQGITQEELRGSGGLFETPFLLDLSPVAARNSRCRDNASVNRVDGMIEFGVMIELISPNNVRAMIEFWVMMTAEIGNPMVL